MTINNTAHCRTCTGLDHAGVAADGRAAEAASIGQAPHRAVATSEERFTGRAVRRIAEGVWRVIVGTVVQMLVREALRAWWG